MEGLWSKNGIVRVKVTVHASVFTNRLQELVKKHARTLCATEVIYTCFPSAFQQPIFKVKFTSTWNFLLEYVLQPLKYRACISLIQAFMYTQKYASFMAPFPPPLISPPLKSWWRILQSIEVMSGGNPCWVVDQNRSQQNSESKYLIVIQTFSHHCINSLWV